MPLLAALAAPAWSGSTGSTELLPIQGAGASRSQGDYVSDGGGLGTYYAFFVEVPPDASRLVIDLFDADVLAGSGEAAANRDEARGGGTTADYSLRDPFGTVMGTQYATGSTTEPSGGDNAWTTLFDSSATYPPTLVAGNGALLDDDDENDSISVTIPGSPCAASNLLLAFVVIDDDDTITATAPAGWSTVDQGAMPGNAGQLATFYKIAAASDLGATATFSWSGDEQAIAVVACYRGVDTASPIDASGSNTGISDEPTAPGVTTTVANATVVRVYGADDGDLDGTPFPAGHTGLLNIDSDTGGGEVSLGLAQTTQAVAGATGSAGFDLGANEQWRAATIAVRPTPSGEPLPGHWELRIDQSGSGGDDINAIGLRAHDGTSGAGGTELNVYAHSYMTYGTNNEGAPSFTRDYTHHPYITSGCDFSFQDFDWDSNNTDSQGTVDFFLPSGGSAFDTVADSDLSTNDSWADNPVSPFTRVSSDSQEYGVWQMDVSISGFTGGNGNYGQIVVKEDEGSGPPPTAQPESDSFRIYLPTDSGSAPAKPYLEQLVRHEGGPNPPDTGQTSTFTVTVRLVNPTAYPITFSTSNLVTAHVPGSGVVYAGNDQVSQGSVTSEPSLGGTGDVTWNPGTVAAGATEILSYEVDVTPTSDGQILDVTGTPATDGTVAAYVDETCSGASPACSGAQLAGATHTLGPLCELQVEENALTYVKIAHFDAYPTDDGWVVEWRSAAEAGTMAYELWRADPGDSGWTPVTERRVPAHLGAPQGATYRVVDPLGGEGTEYALAEIDRRGNLALFGPYRAAFDSTGATRLSPAGPIEIQARTPRTPDESILAGPRQAEIETRRRPAWPFSRARGLKIEIRQTGLYRLDAESLAAASGIRPGRVRSALRSGRLSLHTAGRQVAWTTDGDSLLFYGLAIDSLYTRDNVYWLQFFRRGTRMQDARLASMPPADTAVYVARQVYERDLTAPLVLGLDPESDYWFWSGLVAGVSGFDRWQTEVAVHDVAEGTDGELRISLLGADLGGPGGYHEIEVYLDGSLLGADAWTGAAHELVVDVPSDLLDGGGAGTRAVEVVARASASAGDSFVFVDRLELSYARHYRAISDRLDFTAGGNPAVSLSGFSAPPVILDVSNPHVPVLLSPAGRRPGSLSFRPEPGRQYAAFGPTAILEPHEVLAGGGGNPLGEPAQHIVLVPAQLAEAADALVEHRLAQGISSRRVLLEDVMDRFHHGVSDPRAIREFMRQATARWPDPPRYLTLVGLGSYDYRNVFGSSPNFMPPLLVITDSGLFSSDDAFGDLDGDGLAEVAVGRIPAADEADVEAYVDKLVAYESGDAASSGVVFVSDRARAPEQIAFAADSAVLAGAWDAADVTRLDHASQPREALREAFFQRLADGPALVNYLGHGAADAWSDSGLLTLDDLDDLAGPPAVFTGLTCLMNRFEVPGFPSLGAGLLTAADAGAVAVWSPTAPESHQASRALGLRLHRGLAERLESRQHSGPGAAGEILLGDLIRELKAESAAAGVPIESLRTYTLFGDPALHWRIEPRAPDPPETPSGGPRE